MLAGLGWRPHRHPARRQGVPLLGQQLEDAGAKTLESEGVCSVEHFFVCWRTGREAGVFSSRGMPPPLACPVPLVPRRPLQPWRRPGSVFVWRFGEGRGGFGSEEEQWHPLLVPFASCAHRTLQETGSPNLWMLGFFWTPLGTLNLKPQTSQRGNDVAGPLLEKYLKAGGRAVCGLRARFLFTR